MEQKIDRKASALQRLVKHLCERMGVTIGQFYSRYARDASRTRHIFVLVATDQGYPHLTVARFMDMDLSYVTQVRRRNFALRETDEYKEAKDYFEHLAKVPQLLEGGRSDSKD
jgi:hypothetical protein